jgi:hypothetical protein
MQVYNKIMLYFWLLVGIASLGLVSYQCYIEGVDKWGFYFSMPLVAFLMFFFKKWMMKRMDRHLEFLNSKKNEKS